MYPKSLVFCAVLSVLYLQIAAEEPQTITKAIVKSCPGCSLNRLTEVRAFIYDDLPKYDNVEFVKIHGHKPELIFLNDSDDEVETIPLSDLNRQQCNNLLTEKGFINKEERVEEDKNIARAAVRSCPGCSLNRLEDVKAFVYDDLPKYENVEFIKIQGHRPELVFFNNEGEEVEIIQLSDLNREQCNDLLKSNGFQLKEASKTEL